MGGIRIREIKHKLTGERLEYPCLALERSDAHAVLLYFIEHASQVGDVFLPSGTATYAYYWADRPYNVYHWVAGDGRTVAFYVNLADQVRIGDDAVEWRDLAVDLLCTPDGQVRILDGDELRQSPAALRVAVEAIRTQLLGHRHEIIAEVAAATRRLRQTGRGPGTREEESGSWPRTP